MPYVPEDNHCTFRSIREHHGLSLSAVASLANISIGKVWLLENGGYVREEDVDQILSALSRITHNTYTRDLIGGYWTGEIGDAFPLFF